MKNLFELKFDTDNAVFTVESTNEFAKRAEIRRILGYVSDDIMNMDEGTIRDENGNKIGTWKLT